jgi:hypothetical protein
MLHTHVDKKRGKREMLKRRSERRKDRSNPFKNRPASIRSGD